MTEAESWAMVMVGRSGWCCRCGSSSAAGIENGALTEAWSNRAIDTWSGFKREMGPLIVVRYKDMGDREERHEMSEIAEGWLERTRQTTVGTISSVQ
jgi:hypothetical protein